MAEVIVEISTVYGCTYIGTQVGVGSFNGIIALNKVLRAIPIPSNSGISPLLFRHTLFSNKSVANIKECDIITKSIITDEKFIKIYQKNVEEYGIL